MKRKSGLAALAVAAKIHEEEVPLDHLSLEELEKLRERLSQVIYERLQKEVPFSTFDYEAVDDRSMGSLKFEAKTVHGVLSFEGSIGSNGDWQDSTTGLDTGRELNDGPDEGDFGLFDFLPLLHQDTGEKEAQVMVSKAILEWAASYDPEG